MRCHVTQQLEARRAAAGATSCHARRVDHAYRVRAVLVVALLGGVAAAAPEKPAPSGPAKAAPLQVWIGVFDPRLPVHPPWDNAKLTPVAHGGAVRVLAADSGAAASGDVVIVHPLLGKTATGKVDKGAVRSEEHTSELQSRFGISYAVF